ncbi:40S ribosomal protein S21 [Lemmus lemmus]
MLREQPHHWCQGPRVHPENVAEADRVTGRFNGQFKTYAICGPFAGWVSQMILFSDWLKLIELSPRTFDQKRSGKICHK